MEIDKTMIGRKVICKRDYGVYQARKGEIGTIHQVYFDPFGVRIRVRSQKGEHVLDVDDFKKFFEFYVDQSDKKSSLETQVGGDHYTKLKIQPMQYSMENGLDAMQHTIIKYVTRFRDKGGIEDLKKAKHVIDMLIEYEEKEGNSP